MNMKVEKKNQFLINKVFTIPYIDKLINTKNIPNSLCQCINRYVKGDDLTYGSVLTQIYSYMNDNYRNEYFYKNTLLNKLLVEKIKVHTLAALTELPISNSKADFITIGENDINENNGIVYEIKTDLDTFARLQSQIDDYYKVFSYVYVVISSNQFEKAKEFLKTSSVGIYELTKNGDLICRKKAIYNRNDLSYEAMFQLLRKYEFEKIIKEHYKTLPNVNDFQYYRECLKWIKEINIITFQKKVMECLKRRTLLTENDDNIIEIPYELRFYVYFSKRYRNKNNEINRFLNQKIDIFKINKIQ